MKTKHILIGISLALLLTGCAGQLVPHEANQKAALASAAQIETTHESEITKQVNGTPAPINITQSGTSNTVSVAVLAPAATVSLHDTAGSTSHTDQQSTASDSYTIPMFVKIIGLAIGLLVLFLVLKYVWTYIRTNSPAVDAAYKLADAKLAEVIGHIESKRAAATDPQVQANLNDLAATANKARGQLAGSQP